MAHLVAILQSNPTLLPCQVHRLSTAVDLNAVAGKAVGVGYYDGGKVLLRKRPGPPHGASLEELAGEVRSEALLATAHRLSNGAFREEDTAPYRFRGWLFGGTGRILPLGERSAVLSELPDFMQRGLLGPSDAELAFLTTLGRIHQDTRNLEGFDLDPKAVAAALLATHHRLDEVARAAGVSHVQTTSVMTNGRMLVALRRGRPLSYALLEGLAECPRCEFDRETSEKDPKVRAHRTLKAVVLASAPKPAPGVHWLDVPDNHVLSVSRDLSVRVEPVT